MINHEAVPTAVRRSGRQKGGLTRARSSTRALKARPRAAARVHSKFIRRRNLAAGSHGSGFATGERDVDRALPLLQVSSDRHDVCERANAWHVGADDRPSRGEGQLVQFEWINPLDPTGLQPTGST